MLKIPISIAPATVAQSSAATSVSSTAKSVVITTVAGGTKRVVLSVPAYSLAHSKPVVTSGSASMTTSSASVTGTSKIKVYKNFFFYSIKVFTAAFDNGRAWLPQMVRSLSLTISSPVQYRLCRDLNLCVTFFSA